MGEPVLPTSSLVSPSSSEAAKEPLQQTPLKHPVRRAGKTAPRVLLSGYYGFDNFGDELICKALTQELKARGCRPFVLSFNPKATQAAYKVGSGLRHNPLALGMQLAKADVMISGGGGLFQDSTGPNSPLYYGGLILLARLVGVPVAHVFQSVGPLTTGLGQWMSRQALNACHWVCVRDEKSAKVVEDLTGTRPMVAADAAWLLPALQKPAEKPAEKQEGVTERNAEKEKQGFKGLLIGVSLRPHARFNHAGLQQLAQTLAQWVSVQTVPVELAFLVCQPNMDESVLQAFQFALEAAYEKSLALNKPLLRYRWVQGQAALEETIPECDALFGMRFHALVAGLMAGVPVLGLSYDPKVDALLESIPLTPLPVEQLESLTLEALQGYWATYPTKEAIGAWVLQQRAMATTAFNALDLLLLSAARQHVAV